MDKKIKENFQRWQGDVLQGKGRIRQIRNIFGVQS
jgi:hypothetical protein